jgi:hypothetical protein
MFNDNVYNPENKKDNLKETLALLLVDYEKLPFITITKNKEIHKLGVLLSLTLDENILRRKLNIPENPLLNVILEQLKLRCSLNGKRSEQIVKIISGIIEEENKNNMEISNKLNKIIKAT